MPVNWNFRNFASKHLMITNDLSMGAIRREAERRAHLRDWGGIRPGAMAQLEGLAALFAMEQRAEFSSVRAPRNTILAMSLGTQTAWATEIMNGGGVPLHGNVREFELRSVFLVESDPSGNVMGGYGARVSVAVDAAPPVFSVGHLHGATPIAVHGAGQDPFEIRRRRAEGRGSTQMIGSDDMSDSLGQLFAT